MIKDEINVEVAADGTHVMEENVSFRALNEAGRSKLVLETLPYLPETTDLEVLEASSLTDGVETKVDRSRIQRRKAQGPAQGMNSLMELAIPFSNMKIGSSIRYRVKYTHKKVAFPGLFTMRFFTGLKFPEAGGNAVIRSAKPITWATSGGVGILSVSYAKEGAQYVLRVKQNRSDFKIPVDSSPAYRPEDIARVDLSTGESWEAFVREVSGKYEKILRLTELPPVFKAIATKASAQKTLNGKIDTAVSELAHVMTYSGEWTSLEKFYFPQSLEVLAGRKTGDCKDFATITTAILRNLGLKADVAFVKRSGAMGKATLDLEKPISDKMALPDIFNHAIVHVKDGARDVWVDPTNIVADSSIVFDDLLGSPALIVSPETRGISYLPASNPGGSRLQTQKTIKVNLDETVETKGTISLTGEYSKAVIETALTKSEKEGQELIAGLYGRASKEARSFVEGVDFKTRMTSAFSANVRTLSEKAVVQGKKGEKILIVPFSSRLAYYLQSGRDRVTDFYVGPVLTEDARIKVEGYDFGPKTVGCLARSPWYVMERKFLKVDGGFEIVDHFESKTSKISRDEVNHDRYQFELSHVEGCAYDQAVEIVKLGEKQTLAQRISGYSLSEAKKLLEVGGAESVSKTSQAKQMLEQLLAADPQNKSLRGQYYWALSRVNFLRSDIDRKEYHEEAGKVIDALYAQYPNDPEVLQMKTYFAIRMKNMSEVKKFFSMAYYASPKAFEIYDLGGYVAEKLNQPKVAEGSYLKALTLTKDSEKQGRIYDKLGGVAWSARDFEKAVGYYDKAIERLPKDAWLFSHYLEMLNGLGRWDKAIEVGEKMLEISDFGVGRRMLARSYSGKALSKFSGRIKQGGMMGDPEQDELAVICMKALKYNQTESSCLRMIGFFALNTARVEHKLEEAQKAYDYFDRALKDEDLEDKSDIMNLKNTAGNLLETLKNQSQRMPASAPSGT